MTPEEAIKILNDTPVEISSGSKTTTREYSQMLHSAENALEKQIPKKPKSHTVDVEKLKIGNANWGKGTTVYRCPNCNDFISRTYDFCYKCGQALDWRETE